LVKNLTANRYYYQDGSGSTSHLADSGGQLLEWYRYDLQGTPIVYNPSNNIRSGGSIYGIRHLFTGQQWYSELGLYDLLSRLYSPDIGRFIQADPTGFNGDATNLYRYCGNNALTHSDPTGELTLTGGFQVYGGSFLQGSYSFQTGWSFPGLNPLNWSLGYVSTYTPFTAYDTNGFSWGGGIIATGSYATSFQQFSGWGGVLGVNIQPFADIPSLSIGVDASNLLNGPMAFSESLSFGEALLPADVKIGASKASTGSISVKEIVYDMIGMFLYVDVVNTQQQKAEAMSILSQNLPALKSPSGQLYSYGSPLTGTLVQNMGAGWTNYTPYTGGYASGSAYSPDPYTGGTMIGTAPWGWNATWTGYPVAPNGSIGPFGGSGYIDPTSQSADGWGGAGALGKAALSNM